MDILETKTVAGIPVDESGFEEMFKAHFKKLYAYAMTIVKQEMAAEEIVQNMFYKVWEKRTEIQIQTSVTAYLYRSVFNDSLNFLKHKKVKEAYYAHAARHAHGQSDNAVSRVNVSELQQKLDVALSELPEQCRTIFQMSRFEDMKYQEIADRLGLSVKTIENQMGKALRLLRIKLAEYLPLILAFLIETIKSKNNC